MISSQVFPLVLMSEKMQESVIRSKYQQYYHNKLSQTLSPWGPPQGFGHTTSPQSVSMVFRLRIQLGKYDYTFTDMKLNKIFDRVSLIPPCFIDEIIMNENVQME